MFGGEVRQGLAFIFSEAGAQLLKVISDLSIFDGSYEVVRLLGSVLPGFPCLISRMISSRTFPVSIFNKISCMAAWWTINYRTFICLTS